jgi:hypothetical protein
MNTPTDPPPGARLAEETKLLLGTLAERAEPWLNRMAEGPSAEQSEHTPATCGWCPLCAGLAVLRGDRPELTARAAEHAIGLLAVLRSALNPEGTAAASSGASPAGASSAPGGFAASAASAASGASESEPEPRVQHIAVSRRKPDASTC